MAWGSTASGAAGPRRRPALVDPHGGRLDLEARTLRAVGDPRARFEEDALRMLRAVRLAVTLDFGDRAGDAGRDPGTGATRCRTSRASGWRRSWRSCSVCRCRRLASASWPPRTCSRSSSRSSRPQRGIPQNKIPGDDCWDHTVRTVDAVPADRPVVRLAALLHDIGKPATMADGHFLGHDAVGAEIAASIMARLRTPHADVARVVHLIRHHMFTYDPVLGRRRRPPVHPTDRPERARFALRPTRG